jgi:(2Fe-2S) ferredoxin
MPPNLTDTPCSDLSERAAEPLLATAPESTAVWLLLEYARPWGAKALQESDLPGAVKQHLDAALGAIPGSRLQLIKRPAPAPPGGLAFYVVISGDGEPATYGFQFASYEELCGIDIAAVASGSVVFAGHLSDEPLYLVCTNARRDQCCGRRGSAVYRELAAHAGATAWQTTHLGGHRFAATLVCLPDGVCYGRVCEREVEALVGAHARGEVYRLDRYRGRCSHPPEAQAADYFLRELTTGRGLGRFRLAASEEVAPSRWSVTFRSLPDRATYRLHVAAERVPSGLPLSCGKPGSETSVRYRLEGCEVVQGWAEVAASAPA